MVIPNLIPVGTAEYCLIHILLQRKPAMFSNHFMECIFHFNAYEGHSGNVHDVHLFSLNDLYTCTGKYNISRKFSKDLIMS